MRVYKDTPFEFSLMPWELDPPRVSLMLVVKATFDLVDGAPCTIAEEQVPCLGEVPWDDGDPPSLRTETDYAVFKPRGEWYLHGHAYAPGGRPATVVPIEAAVGKLEKRLAVWGDRAWQRGLLGAAPSEPTPFVSMPLRWERSFSGPRVAANPVGRGVARQGADGPIPLPNIVDPRHPVVSRDDHPPPAGAFAIPSTWAARTRLTGTYDEAWKRTRWPFFPTDFQLGFFQAAPADQRLADGRYWVGDEPIQLVGLHPERGQLETRLPGLRARAFLERVERAPGSPAPHLLERAELEAAGPPRLTEIELRLDTVVIDTDAAQAQCSWRGLIEVSNAALDDVERLYFVHEPIGASHDVEHHARGLFRKVVEEAMEFEGPDEDDEDEVAALEGPATVPAPALPGGDTPDADGDMSRHLADFRTNLPIALSVFAEPSGTPTREELRERLEAHEVDPDEILPPLEIEEPPPELVEPPSLLRLAAIVRRKLGKPFTDLDLTGAPYRKLDLSGVDFSGSRLTDADLSGCVLTGCVFDGATLDRARFTKTEASRASFRGADLTELQAGNARFAESVFDGAVGSDALFDRASFHRASMVDVELEGASMKACDLREAKLDGADFTGADLEGAGFVSSSLVDASLEGARAVRAVFDRCVLIDLRASDGADFTQARFLLANAARAQFQGAILVEANFSGANLEEADLSDAMAGRANFMRANAPNAKLDRTDLREAVLISANLFEASFQEAKLSNADARGAHLFSAGLFRAETHGTLFEGADLRRTLLEPGA